MLEIQPVDGYALVAKPELLQGGKGRNMNTQWKENKDNIWCTYGKKRRHSKVKSWKLHGKPLGKE